ncbi:type II toxin-antitoxin system RelE/ParE family toxin [Fulvimonas soli]|jgi:proteic killer suppression protein|uniref:Proteic killer suppression protein n=1 Tax=Fulvimonas soli TaxID=155197 RepID=A0A316I5H3_9GAMM|nr:type II toxin-antitoxin system RelE/ParE family toxin [Fulvimonas soli]PWK88657.1 proteic killer suppression protein [Fulvimonas soli]TNY26790.1 hypothetical protein BV497_06780 [Fulvimonas soli]
MSKSFASKDTEALFKGVPRAPLDQHRRPARRKPEYLNAAHAIDDLRVPPGNRLEALRGNRAGQHSMRINDQFRVCFVWKDGHAYDVGITDYH